MCKVLIQFFSRYLMITSPLKLLHFFVVLLFLGNSEGVPHGKHIRFFQPFSVSLLLNINKIHWDLKKTCSLGEGGESLQFYDSQTTTINIMVIYLQHLRCTFSLVSYVYNHNVYKILYLFSFYIHYTPILDQQRKDRSLNKQCLNNMLSN